MKLKSRRRLGLLSGSGQFLNAYVEGNLVVYQGFRRESLFEIRLVCLPVNSHVMGAV
jgi:hypothetical protein